MAMMPSVRPPPQPVAPDDFDAGMAERWAAWKTKGRLEAAQTRRRLGAAVTIGAALAVASVALTSLLSR